LPLHAKRKCNNTETEEEITSEQLIAVGLSPATGDSIYVVDACGRGEKK
jgi:hypothetical protein